MLANDLILGFFFSSPYSYELEVTEEICDFGGFLHTGIFAALADIAASSLIYKLNPAVRTSEFALIIYCLFLTSMN